MLYVIPVIVIIGVIAWVLYPKNGITTPRRTAILATVIPPLVVALAAIIFQLLHNAAGKTWVSDISNTLYIIGLGLIGVAILALAGFAVMRKGDVAKGIGFSICITVIIYSIEFGVLEGLGGV